MSQTTRDDFFTLIHKGLRRELFRATTLAATIDWDDTREVGEFAAVWADLRYLLEIHAAHEDEHFFPLLNEGAPDVASSMLAEHDEQDQALTKVASVIDASVAEPTPSSRLVVHRELSAFVAGYMLHMLDEETVVMPAIWRACTDDELARARAAFMSTMPVEDAARSRRAMLPAISRSERSAMLRMLRASAPDPVFAAVLDESRELLNRRDWARLSADLAVTTPASGRP